MQRKKQEQSDAAYGALWKNKFAGKNKAPFLTGELTLNEAFMENLICRYDRDGVAFPQISRHFHNAV